MINTLGICEVRWTGAGKISSGGYTVIYSGGQKVDTLSFIQEGMKMGLDLFWMMSMPNLERVFGHCLIQFA